MSRDTRKCIKDFVRHVEALEAEEDPEGNGFNREYRLIHEVQVKNRRDNVFQITAGKADNNLKKNRYKDILPYDEHRVLLSPREGEENSDYINASRLMGVKGTGGYVASQGPLASTVDDYWRMIWECNVEVVFMACKIVELGKIKCKQYWNDVDKFDIFGDITVFTEAEEEISSDFIRRKFRVKRDEEERYVTQFHYLGWPDHGIPDDPAHIRDLISIVRQTRENDQAPLLVHCSAGCGRTGAIVAIDFVWTLLEHGRFDETFSLYDLICNFREQRMSMVQTADQYALVNKVLKALCTEWLDKMASHTYVNVELKQASDSGNDENYENTVFVESSHRPNSNTRLAQERPSGQSADSGPGADAGDLSPPPFNAPKPPTMDLPPSFAAPKPPSGAGTSSSSYENVVLLPDRTPVLRGGAPADGAAANESTQPPVHKTVIQLGQGAASTPAGSSGGANEVLNLVRAGSTSSTSSTTSAAALGVTPPTSPVMATLADLQRSKQEPDNSPVYASVHKDGRVIPTGGPKPSSASSAAAATGTNKTKQPSGGGRPQILTDTTGYSLVEFKDGGVGAGTGSARHLVSPSRGPVDPYSLAEDVSNTNRNDPYSLASNTNRNDSYSLAAQIANGSSSNPLANRVLHPIQPAASGAGGTPRTTGQVSNGPQSTGFGERLPKVKGPVSAPGSWGTGK